MKHLLLTLALAFSPSLAKAKSELLHIPNVSLGDKEIPFEILNPRPVPFPTSLVVLYGVVFAVVGAIVSTKS